MPVNVYCMQDLQTLDLEPYQFSGVNFTGIRLIDPKDSTVLQIAKRHEWCLDNPSQLRVEHALMYDAVQLFAKAFKQLEDATKGNVKQLSCDGNSRWEHGLSLSNFMRSVRQEKCLNLNILNISNILNILIKLYIHINLFEIYCHS